MQKDGLDTKNAFVKVFFNKLPEISDRCQTCLNTVQQWLASSKMFSTDDASFKVFLSTLCTFLKRNHTDFETYNLIYL